MMAVHRCETIGSMAMIGIVDYRMGNLRSVQKAFEHVGAQAAILSGPEQMKPIDRLVLPGVGAFGDGMRHLKQDGWIEGLGDFVRQGKPFLGICLGMQLLFDGSQEGVAEGQPPVAGLSWLRGQVVRFKNRDEADRRFKVPHMGWNTIRWNRKDPLLQSLDQDDAFYFVHSYHVGADASVVSATADYVGPFCASIWHENIWATQFHPEKSQRVGLKILRQFASL